MRKFRVFLFIAVCLLAQAAKPQTDGIVFFHGSLDSLFAEAAKQNRLIFIDAFAEWCGPCKSMSKNVFPDKEVGSFYNANFINYKFDMEKGEGPEFAKKYQVRVYPTLMFLDANGKLMHRSAGGRSTQAFIELGKLALNPDKRLFAHQARYESGKSSPEQVIEYAAALKDAYMDYQTVINAYFASCNAKDMKSPVYRKAVMEFAQVGSKEFIYLLNNQADFYKENTQEAVFLKISNSFSQTLSRTLREKKDRSLKSLVDSIFQPYNQEKAEVFKLQLLAVFSNYQKSYKDFETYGLQLLDKHYNSLPSKPLNDIFMAFYQSSVESDVLKKVIEHSKNAAAKYNSYSLRYTFSLLLFKNNQYEEAEKEVNKALEAAAKEGLAAKEANDLKSIIQEKRKAGN